MNYVLTEEQKDEWLNTIEFDLTTFCNLKCMDCAHGCNKFPSKDYLTVEQVKDFCVQSAVLNKKWHKIGLLGGEPTLNPELFEILDLLGGYHQWGPDTNIWMMTNGTNDNAIKHLRIKYDWLNIVINNDHSR